MKRTKTRPLSYWVFARLSFGAQGVVRVPRNRIMPALRRCVQRCASAGECSLVFDAVMRIGADGRGRSGENRGVSARVGEHQGLERASICT